MSAYDRSGERSTWRRRMACSMSTETLTSALASLPETRREILVLLKRTGHADTETIGKKLGITPSGTRQHMVALQGDGLITHQNDRDGRGRPKHIYQLTPAGDALFPRNYV